jgi:hypothetical protein
MNDQGRRWLRREDPSEPDKLAYTMQEAEHVSGFTRSRLYLAVADGSLRTFKVGRRRMTTRSALKDLIAKLERDSAGRAA